MPACAVPWVPLQKRVRGHKQAWDLLRLPRGREAVSAPYIANCDRRCGHCPAWDFCGAYFQAKLTAVTLASRMVTGLLVDFRELEQPDVAALRSHAIE